jgi:membrane-associated phospholipid phosphatase
MIEKILKIDHELSQKLRLPESAKFLRAIAIFLAHSGDSWFWLAGLLLVWLLRKDEWHTTAAFLAAGILILAALVLAIKFLVRRQRPEGEWGAIYRNTDPHSFPSGHAARAVLLAGLFWALGIQPLAWILILWAPLVSLARVSMGVHYLVDVIAGWLLGLAMIPVLLSLQPVFHSLFPFAFSL